MKPNTDLFILIKSLTPSEKRSVTLAGKSFKSKPVFLALFDIIDDQHEYNESAAKAKLKSISSSQNFSLIKDYLITHIVNSLKQNETYNDHENTVDELITDYKIYTAKGLYDRAGKVLLKAKSIAYKYELFTRCYTILNLQYVRIIYSKETASFLPLLPIIQERKQVLRIIENYSVLADILFCNRILLRQKRYGRTPEERRTLKNNIQPLLNKNSPEPLSRIAVSMKNQALSEYYNAIGEIEKAIKVLRKDLSSRFDLKKSRFIDQSMLAEITIYLNMCVRVRDWTDFEETLKLCKSLIKKRMLQPDLILFERTLHAEIMYHVLNSEFDLALAVWLTHRKTFTEYESKISVAGKTSVKFAVAVNYFYLGRYKDTIRLCNNILNSSDNSLEEYTYARILTVLAYFDTQDELGLESALRSTYRILRREGRLNETEKLLLRFIRNSTSMTTKKLITNGIRQLLLKLNAIYQQFPIEQQLEYYIDFRKWLQNKLNAS